jgi:hypothetical protein
LATLRLNLDAPRTVQFVWLELLGPVDLPLPGTSFPWKEPLQNVAVLSRKINFFEETIMSNKRWIVMLSVAFAALCLASAAAPPDQNNAGLAFDKLKGLAGQWEATTDKGKATTTYEVVSGGTALLERIRVAGESEMLTVYHLDGNHLVLTHYCEAGNQPRMQAAPFDPASNQIRFDFVSITNLASANAGHMHQAVIKFLGPEVFTGDWSWYENGKEGFRSQMQFHRVR